MCSQKVKSIRMEFVSKLPLEDKEKKVLVYLLKKSLKATLHIEEKVALGYLFKELVDKGISLQELSTNLGIPVPEIERLIRTYERKQDLHEKAKERIDKLYTFYCSGT
ncbi:MAG: hypothetical protein DRJ40_05425 [Thermoprotei archaeon]|nr:MAG: hypothetical protein DRJ40_04100 [Thermoprotei archaeon]RLE56835.1 MAG: hypothetical protein DRJ40_05425 [Thermoprotei archaeon]